MNFWSNGNGFSHVPFPLHSHASKRGFCCSLSAVPVERAPSGIDTNELMPKVGTLRTGKKCCCINVVRIVGAPTLSGAVRERITRDFNGRCLGVIEIEQILAEITKDYISRGFITTCACLPQQGLSNGRLEIMMFEGVTDKIMLEDSGCDSIRLENVFLSATGLLNLRDFKQGIEQVNRLSSNNAVLGIQSGASTVVIRN
jgi:hemolysin activation/secretion protein